MRIGILSFAHLHAESYAALLQQMPEVEFIGIADDNLERGRHFAEMFGVRLYPDAPALIADAPDAVIVTSENARHLPLVRLAAGAGVHVLCEKPLATTVEDAREIVRLCRAAGVTLMTAFPMRFNAPAMEVKRQIETGALGAIYGVNSTNQGQLPELHQRESPAFLKRDWFVDPVLAGGGAVADHVVHLTDLLRWFLGREVVEVYAATNRILHGERVQVETGGLVMLTFADGTFASIDCSWSKPAGYPTWGGLALEIVAEGGLVTMDAFRQVMTVTSADAGRPRCAYWGSDADGAMLTEFAAAVRERRDPAVTGEDGLRAVEVVAAAYESAARGEPVWLG
ncbi:MAG: Gfo/Idh/MocA family oxidoreductase [Anaerolineae bacterium]|nr:Gfo/Idh/MocA family oxidoreductase [Anaerolineae bacterium]NUQ05808.1 Gfo/Idh/MocA family oxidoreductase [Anaerolineae bacterium]